MNARLDHSEYRGRLVVRASPGHLEAFYFDAGAVERLVARTPGRGERRRDDGLTPEPEQASI